MLEGKALIEDTDMPMKMQIQAMASASQALDLYDVFDCKSIAAHIKKVRSCSQLDVFFLMLCGISRFCFDVLLMRVKGLCVGRSLTRSMGVDGSVWWDPTLGAFSLTLKGASYISH